MSARQHARAVRAVVAVLAVAVALAATVLETVPLAAAETARPKPPRFARPGRYAAGVTTLALPDRQVEVWYPAAKRATRDAPRASVDLVAKVPPGIRALLPSGTTVVAESDAARDVPAARKRRGFPLVLVAHGTAGYREQLDHLASHLATWGFVVAAPDLLERGLGAVLGDPPGAPRDDVEVLTHTVALLRAESARVAGPLAGRVRPGPIAVVGQAAGGATALRYGLEPEVATAIVLSSSGYDPTDESFVAMPPVPVLFVAGGADQVVPMANVEAAFANAMPPARLVAIEGAGHANLAGICPLGGPDGLAGLASASGLPVPPDILRLASDGCTSPAPDPDPTWAPVQHAVTAQLRAAFGIDPAPKGLGPRAMGRFAPLVVHVQERR